MELVQNTLKKWINDRDCLNIRNFCQNSANAKYITKDILYLAQQKAFQPMHQTLQEHFDSDEFQINSYLLRLYTQQMSNKLPVPSQ